MKKPLVSVIVPTKNSAEFLSDCLQSIADQTYPNIELIVVDNSSTDNTEELAKRFTKYVYTKGPERSAQVNYGVEKAKGEYVYKVDSDFLLDKVVVHQCVREITKGYDAIVVHNSPDVRVSWIARIRKFEVDMYKFNLTHSSARFIKKEVFDSIGGFDQTITAGEDYDFQNKLNRNGFKTGFVEAEALHLGEPKHLLPHLRKYYHYGKDFVHFQAANPEESNKQLGLIRGVYVQNWRSFMRHPGKAIAFLLYNTLKYGAGGAGLLVSKIL